MPSKHCLLVSQSLFYVMSPALFLYCSCRNTHSPICPCGLFHKRPSAQSISSTMHSCIRMLSATSNRLNRTSSPSDAQGFWVNHGALGPVVELIS
ncbi:hypothetical protein M011DRAFT_318890 [Sporormia fimetaria CBS 119925]|uniref:Secreted protein n=1 Tax=Sporormia fimetaria CBS 119925 TaxID=1340428 RepID=A0A6A6VGU4_9PLEO|nr:hypothetical protein M011DRAFT_318890 [Sporormia fimetaria CBS 119925]